MGDREELDALRRLAELEAKAAGNATAEPVAASQRDVRMAEPPAPARSRSFPGDAGASLSAAEAFGAANDMIDRLSTKWGGFVTDKAMDYGASPEGAAVAGALNKGVAELAPSLAGGVVGSAAKAPGLARTWMQSALKPNRSMIDTGKASKAVETMLEKGIPATREGLDQMAARVNELEKIADDLVQQSKGTLSMDAVMERLKPVYERYLESGNVGPVKAAAMEMRANPLVSGTDDMTVQMAQSLKEGAYRRIGDKGYGAGLAPAGERDAYKAYARGLKEDIEAAVPGVAPLNKETSDLINAIKVTAPRVGMEANKNMAGLGWLLAPGHSPSATLAFFAWLGERSPYVKSLLAQQAYSGAGGRNLGALLGGGDALVNSSYPSKPEDVGRK